MIPAQFIDRVREVREQEREGAERLGAAFRASVQSSMQRIVRRVARCKRTASAVEREILARLTLGMEMDVAAFEGEESCRNVAKEVSDQLLDQWFAEIDSQADTVALSQPATLVVN